MPTRQPCLVLAFSAAKGNIVALGVEGAAGNVPRQWPKAITDNEFRAIWDVKGVMDEFISCHLDLGN